MSSQATTFSTFYFGFEIDKTNKFLNFSEGGSEITAEISIGSFTLTEILTEVKTAMDSVGGQAYTVSVDRSTRLVTISAPSTFELLLSSGSQNDVSIFSEIGFTQTSDLTGQTSYTGASPAGKRYDPQFLLQSFVDKEDRQEKVSPSVNEAADGSVEIVSFGRKRFFEMDIQFITDLPMDGKFIKNNPSGLADAREFMQFITDKNPLEFMKDIKNPGSFDKVILESTPESREGIGYTLKERLNDGLPGIFDTGVLTFRVLT